MLQQPPTSTLFPYTTLFRSDPLSGPHLHDRVPILSEGHAGIVPHGQILQRGGFGVQVDLRRGGDRDRPRAGRSEEHTSELQSQFHLVCRLLLEKKNKKSDRN